MGLDSTIYADRRVGNIEGEEILIPFIDNDQELFEVPLNTIQCVRLELAYWRKRPALNGWLLEKLCTHECGDHYLPRDLLVEFTEWYEQYYPTDCEYEQEIIARLRWPLSSPKWTYTYSTSW